MKKLWGIILSVLFLFMSGGTYCFLDISKYANAPARAEHLETFITVCPGQGFDSISEKLHQEGLIKNPLKFKLLALIKRQDKKIKAGEYRLSPSMTPMQLLETMAKGSVFFYKVTIPEGYNLYQIASVISGTGLMTEKDFLATVKNPDFVREKGIDATSFEGYLFPDTYHFSKNVTARRAISAMVKQFWSVFTPEWKAQADKLKLSVHEVITLASIIEKETGDISERPLIASVFHNRLKRGMRLQSDPTVIYGIKNFDGNLTRKHLNEHAPYNTYKIKGLPPGPIANPGRESIKAALFPAETRYLYFVSKNDSTHEFSANLRDHNRAVRKYQRRH